MSGRNFRISSATDLLCGCVIFAVSIGPNGTEIVSLPEWVLFLFFLRAVVVVARIGLITRSNTRPHIYITIRV